MKNLDRISREIRRLAREVAPRSGLSADALCALAFQIVDATDRQQFERGRDRRSRKIKPLIQDAAQTTTTR